jgi:peptidoglycan/xylan/chitin deacetylase (PgdA/CDA1 family)
LGGNIHGQEPGSLSDTGIPILCYHRILLKPASLYDLTPEQLEEELLYLKEQGYQTITASQLLAAQERRFRLPSRPIVLTFDDGHKSHYRFVLPLLKKYGFSATFFIYTAVIAEASAEQLTWDELREMAAAGMDIESHSMTHTYLSKQRPNEAYSAYLQRLDQELIGSRELLQNRLGRPVELLAYPYGWFNKSVEIMAVKAGYRGLFTVNWGNNFPDENPLRFKRRVLGNTTSRAEFEEILTARPLRIEALEPLELATVSQPPALRFRLNGGPLELVKIRVRDYQAALFPVDDGIYTFHGIETLPSGYQMVIVRGYGPENRFYLGSWGFEYYASSEAATKK